MNKIQEANDLRSLVVAMLCASYDRDLQGWELLTEDASEEDAWTLIGAMEQMILDLGGQAAGSPDRFRTLLGEWRPGYSLRGTMLDEPLD
jgi:hypothetical protein